MEEGEVAAYAQLLAVRLTEHKSGSLLLLLRYRA